MDYANSFPLYEIIIANIAVLSLILFVLSSIVFLCKLLVKKQVKKCGLFSVTSLACFVICILLEMFILPDLPKPIVNKVEDEKKVETYNNNQQKIDELNKEINETDNNIKKFAEENNISIKLAESVKEILLETDIPDSLNMLNGWEQVEDYAYGQRYIAESVSLSNKKQFYLIFYVQDDEVISVRDRKNNLEYIWKKEN